MALNLQPAVARHWRGIDAPKRTQIAPYEVKMASTRTEIEAALRLRHRVFNLELGGLSGNENALESDQFDAHARHLIVVSGNETVGTYRLNSLETVGRIDQFYSFTEFSIEDLPPEMIASSIEIGRACIDRQHRNSRVLFLLLKGLAGELMKQRKRYLFGCSSIFTNELAAGDATFRKLIDLGHYAPHWHVNPRIDEYSAVKSTDNAAEIPDLLAMYLRFGAKVCGLPKIDVEFNSIDFFTILDRESITARCRKLFF